METPKTDAWAAANDSAPTAGAALATVGAPTAGGTPTAVGAPIWRTAASRVADLVQAGHRLLTGIPSLDAVTRGGIPLGGRVIVGGPPGAGKTTLAVGWAWQWACDGYHVAIVATDEPLIGIVMRLGQIAGIDRRDLEAGDTTAHAELSERFAELGDRLLLVDGDDDLGPGLVVTVERVSAELRRRREADPAAKGSILVLDSLQTATTARTADADGPRARVDEVIIALRIAAAGHGHLTIATSEVSRGAYASKDPKAQTSDLAAYKESGGIEYKADLGIMLRVVGTAGGDFVDAALPKNRLRGVEVVAAFRLELNRSRATFCEVALPSEEERDEEADALDVARRARIIEAIEKTAAPLMNQTELRRRCRKMRPPVSGQDGRWNAAAKSLIGEGEITLSKKLGYRIAADEKKAAGEACQGDAGTMPARLGDAPQDVPCQPCKGGMASGIARAGIAHGGGTVASVGTPPSDDLAETGAPSPPDDLDADDADGSPSPLVCRADLAASPEDDEEGAYG